ncbi:MAG: NUDIX domain-containing protein [Bacteroidota bacterium]|nr:NUDIX domain-containing protein [Bacteroidota bacterium]
MTRHPLEKFRFCPVCGSSEWVINNEKSKRCLHCNFVYYANVSAAVAVFIRNKEGALLVCRRKKNPAAGTLDLPGGFVDIRETAQEAVIREIHEELGIHVTSMTFLTSIPNEYVYSDMTIHTLDLLFDCEVGDFSCMEAADDVADAFFMPLNTISPDDFGLNSIKKGIIAFLNKNI